MVKNKPHIFPSGLVYIKTYNETFDCIGKIISYNIGEYDERRDQHIDYYLVEVIKYMKGSYSKKEQKYYRHEIKDILSNKINKKTVTLLYTGD